MTDADLPALVGTAFGADVAVVMLDKGFDGLSAWSDDAGTPGPAPAGRCSLPR